MQEPRPALHNTEPVRLVGVEYFTSILSLPLRFPLQRIFFFPLTLVSVVLQSHSLDLQSLIYNHVVSNLSDPVAGCSCGQCHLIKHLSY